MTFYFFAEVASASFAPEPGAGGPFSGTARGAASTLAAFMDWFSCTFTSGGSVTCAGLLSFGGWADLTLAALLGPRLLLREPLSGLWREEPASLIFGTWRDCWKSEAALDCWASRSSKNFWFICFLLVAVRILTFFATFDFTLEYFLESNLLFSSWAAARSLTF